MGDCHSLTNGAPLDSVGKGGVPPPIEFSLGKISKKKDHEISDLMKGGSPTALQAVSRLFIK